MAELFAELATKKSARARIAAYGVSGSGKTWTALLIAGVLCPEGGKVGLIDTEAGSASKYADRFAFYPGTMKAPFSPQRFCGVVDAAAAAGVDVLVIDGVTPFWSGPGGVLSIVDDSRQRGPAGGWKDGTPAQQAIISAIVNAPMHVIVTIRAKSDTVIEQEPGKPATVRKVGVKPEQRDGFDYEFDFVLYLDLDHSAKIEKARMHGQVGTKIDADPTGELDPQPIVAWAREVRAWLSDGVEEPAAVAPAVEPTGEPRPQPAPAPVEPLPDPQPPAPAAPTPAENAGAPSEARVATRSRIADAMRVLGELNASRHWADEISAALPGWYDGRTTERALDDSQAANLADRLEATVERIRAAAS